MPKTKCLDMNLLKCACGVLLIIIMVMLMPVVLTDAQAEEMKISATTNATLFVKSSVALSTQNELTMEATPKSTGTFTTGTTSIRVETNNVSGYAVYLSAGDDGSLKSGDKSNTARIKPVNGTLTRENFAEHLNSWGYANTTNASAEVAEYEAIPEVASGAVFESTEQAGSDTYDLSVGVATGADLPSGEYNGEILISVVANPMQVTNLMQLTYMQDMNSTICENTMDYVDVNNYATKQLIDVRDGKEYWVAKLADGKCWMTQNLAYVISAGANTALKPDTSQVSATTAMPTSTISNALSVAAANNTTAYSWSFGARVVAAPTAAANCGNTANVDTCAKVGVVNVADKTKWQPTYRAQMGTWNTGSGDKEQIVAVRYTDPSNPALGGEYDPHYLAGIYYQFNAATANTGKNTGANSYAPASICPKGWRLPTIENRLEAKSDLGDLLGAYGFMEGGVAGSVENTYDDNNMGYNIAKAPLYFARTGTVNVRDGYTSAIGAVAAMWTNTTYNTTGSSANAFTGVVNMNTIGIYTANYQWVGYSVRCLAI